MQYFAVIKLWQQQCCCNVYEEKIEPSRHVCSTLWADLKGYKKCWRGGIEMTVVNVETSFDSKHSKYKQLYCNLSIQHYSCRGNK